jgi:hypothetical protein
MRCRHPGCSSMCCSFTYTCQRSGYVICAAVLHPSSADPDMSCKVASRGLGDFWRERRLFLVDGRLPVVPVVAPPLWPNPMLDLWATGRSANPTSVSGSEQQLRSNEPLVGQAHLVCVYSLLVYRTSGQPSVSLLWVSKKKAWVYFDLKSEQN